MRVACGYSVTKEAKEIQMESFTEQTVAFYCVYVRAIDAISSQMHGSAVIPKDLGLRLCISENRPRRLC